LAILEMITSTFTEPPVNNEPTIEEIEFWC
jgi:hypothetical protein